MSIGVSGSILQHLDALAISWNNGYTYSRSPGGPQFSQWEPMPENLQYATLVLLKEASVSGAKCLDGSPPGYYIRRGVGDGRPVLLRNLDSMEAQHSKFEHIVHTCRCGQDGFNRVSDISLHI